MHHQSTRLQQTILLALTLAATPQAHAQFDLEDSLTTASLRGIHSVGNGIAWASGTDGTVLRTEDGGFEWQPCAIPPGAEHLDFRGIQAFDENTAVVMSSGKGNLSRLYKTTDGCRTWKLVFVNPNKDGFWDALKMIDRQYGLLLGDPAHFDSRDPTKSSFTFRLRVTHDGGETWVPVTDPRANALPGTGLHPIDDEAFFAASNSSMAVLGNTLLIATSSGRILHRSLIPASFRSAGCGMPDPSSGECGLPWQDWLSTGTPLHQTSSSSGAFAISSNGASGLVIVGGDYAKPALAGPTAAVSSDAGQHWSLAQTPPHGYRSSVVYDPTHKTWITVGPNGTDISRDDGRNWTALHPGPNQPPVSGQDADKNWNALSLPFVVGPHGRIGKLRDDALKP